MRRLTKLTAGLVVPAVLAGGLVAAPGYAHDDPARTTVTAHRQHHQYTPREVFRGLFFGHGPVAGLFPQYFADAPAETPASRASENTAMDRIERRQPGTLRTVYDGVTSGSPSRTRSAMALGVKALHLVLTKDGPGADDLLPLRECAAIAIAVWIWIWKYQYKYEEWGARPQASSDVGVTADRKIYDITQALGQGAGS